LQYEAEIERLTRERDELRAKLGCPVCGRKEGKG
jgi:ribosomal protein S14